MPTLTIPTIKWGKRKQRSQMCELFTEDGRIVDVEMDVLRGCVDDVSSGQGWIIDASNQYVNSDDKCWTQILWERSSLPLCMINDTKVDDLTKLINEIYRESKEDTKLEQYKKAARSEFMNKILWLIAIPCIAAMVIAAINYFGGGK